MSTLLTFGLLLLPITTSSAAGELPVALSPAHEWRGPAFEVNVLWPFFPGGITDLRLMVPMLRTDEEHGRGELVFGLHSDFAWRLVRDKEAGKVAFLGVKLGWRQFLYAGGHLEFVAHLGWRHEDRNAFDGGRLDGFQGRLWGWGGYQHELNPRIYLNLRGGAGLHLFRTDRFGDRERILAGGADLNLGFRFE